MINQLAYIKSRQSHAINDIDEKTMIYSFEDLYTRENDIFLQWDFKTLRSKYYKDLSVSDGGSIAFEEGQIILGDETTLTYQINKFFPKRNFAISVKYTDDTISNDGLFSIVFNQQPSLLFSIGYNEVLEMYTISYNTISFTDDTFFMVLPSIDNYTTLPSYVVGGENEITLVIDHDVNQEIRLFINDSLVAYNSFDNTKDILFDTNTFMKIYNSKAGVKINHLIIYDILPELYTNAVVVDDPILFDIEQWAETQTDYTMDTEYQLGSEPYYFAPLIRYVRMAIDDLTKFPVSGSSFKITVDWQDAVYPNPDLYSWQFGVGHDEYNKHGGFTILVQGTSIYLYFYNSSKTIVKFANLYSLYGQNQNQHYREEIIYESDTLKYTYNHYEGGNMETIVNSSFGYLTENWGYSSEFDTQPKYFLQSTVSGHHFYKLTVETY